MALTKAHNRMIEGVSVNVFDYGAVGDGTTDDTAAFNLALKAADAYGDDVKYICLNLDGGDFAVLGTVYVRKGQTINGGGAHIFMSSTGSFKLGFRSDETQDSGGAPPFIQDMWIEGGLKPVDAVISGYTVRNVFFSFPASGPTFGGTDGVISDCIFDNGSTLVNMSGRNMTMTNCNFYVGNTSLNLKAVDSVISNCVFNYPAIAAITWDGPAENQNVRIDNCSFMKNAQNSSTFKGFIWIRNVTGAPVGKLHVSNCNFRNCYGAAITNIGTGTHELDIENCTFDGDKTLSAYAQSTTMYALDMQSTNASKGIISIRNCKFRNLLDTPIKVGSTEEFKLNIFDCEFKNNSGTESIDVTAGPDGSTITLGNIKGDGKNLISLAGSSRFFVNGWLSDWLTVQNDGTYDYVEVPYGGASLWDVTLIANQNPAGNNLYRSIKNASIGVSYDFDGSVLVTQLTEQDNFTSTSASLGFDLALSADLTSIGTGNQVNGVTGPGVVVMYWPDGYGNASIDVQFKLTQRKAV